MYRTALTSRDQATRILRAWRGNVADARALYASLPPERRLVIVQRDAGWRELVPALAELAPARLAEAEALLHDAELMLDLAPPGSLIERVSHGPLRVSTKTETDEGLSVGDEVEERLEAMEAKLERLEALTRELVALLESPPRSLAR